MKRSIACLALAAAFTACAGADTENAVDEDVVMDTAPAAPESADRGVYG